MGIRPDEPSSIHAAKTGDACAALKTYVGYARNLREAYRSRATQNRTWIYVAAITGLAVAAASGALAAASAVAAGTLALLAISGGFTASVFVVIDNSELANVYTVAANKMATALANVEARRAQCPSENDCAKQFAYLTTTVTEARNTLETARTASAAGALARATAQKTLLDQEIKKIEEQTIAKAKEDAAAKAKADADAAKDDKEKAEVQLKDAARTGDPAKIKAAEEDVKAKSAAAAKLKDDASAKTKEAADADPANKAAETAAKVFGDCPDKSAPASGSPPARPSS